MKLFEFIYYCIYKAVFLVKNPTMKNEQRVAGIYTGILFLNTITVLQFLKCLISLEFLDFKTILFICTFIFFLLGLFLPLVFCKKCKESFANCCVL